jgi:DNA-directed RNA polymerase specialized sigma24 family protein
MGDESDDELAIRAKGGSASAMETLYARCRIPLFRYAWRLVGDAALADAATVDPYPAVPRSTTGRS